MDVEHRITVTVAPHHGRGFVEDDAERLLDVFQKVHPEVGPAVGGHLAHGTLDVVLSLAAEDADAAFELGRPLFAAGWEASGLPPVRIVRIEVEAVPADEFQDSELQPA
jgi:hypothetical protein